MSIGVDVVVGMCVVVTAAWSSAAAQPDYSYPTPVFLKDGAKYDYIVVGGGAAGCAVAARLVQRDADVSVLLIEAGPLPPPPTEVPSAAMGLLGTPVDWQYPTISNNVSCLSSRGRACRFSRGKCLGGSSAINYMLYTRGNRRDFDLGLPGWTWDALKPYFLRPEGLQVLDRLPRSSLPYHNTSGLLKLEYFNDPQNPWHERIAQGYRDLKFPRNDDVNGVSQIGVCPRLYGYVRGGRRNSAARAYLARDDVRSRLHVAVNTLCTGVLLDESNTARGVTVLPAAALLPLTLYATKEVILCAGTVGTPQILMLSGIGRAEHLQQMGIPVRVDLSVGDDMSDHALPLLLILVDRGPQAVKKVAKLVSQAVKAPEYLLNGEGPLGSVGLSDVIAFANTRCYSARCRALLNCSAECELPSMQVIHAFIERGLVSLAPPLVQQGVNLDNEVIEQLTAANRDSSVIITSPVLLAPYSRGYIRLASRDPKVPPAIFANYLSDERDVEEMLRSIRIVEQLVETREFKSRNATMLRLKLKGCPPWRRGGARAYWRCYLRHLTYAVFHAAGTCALGRVLDLRLRVRGARRLRVADLSAWPRVPRGNTEAVTLAVAERAVDFIMNATVANN